MTDTHPDSPPAADAQPENGPGAPPKDARSDIEQAVDARSDAVARGEGGEESSLFTDPGQHDSVGGTGGVTRSQDLDQQ